MSAPRYLIDSNHISFLIGGRERVRRRWQEERSDDLGIAAVVIAELEYSRLCHPAPARWDRAWRTLIDGLPVLAFDAAAAVHHARLRHALRRSPIGERDLMIAAIATAQGCRLVTDNLREFRRVPDLVVENWAR